MKTEIENIIYNWTDEIPHLLINPSFTILHLL